MERLEEIDFESFSPSTTPSIADPKDVWVGYRESPVVSEWRGILRDPKLQAFSRKDILGLQKRFIEHVRGREIFKNDSDEDFKQFVSNPIWDATFENARFQYDYMDAMSPAGRVGLGWYRQVMKFPFGLPSKIAEHHPVEGVADAHKLVMEEVGKREAELPIVSAERVLGHAVPRIARWVSEFALLKKAGLPVTSKSLAETNPVLSRAFASAQLLGAHEAVTVEGWEKPGEKTEAIFKSAGFGAAIGVSNQVLGDSILASGAVLGGLSAKSFLQVKMAGGSNEQALKNAWSTVELLVAFQISGKISRARQAQKAYNYQRDRIAATFRKDNPGITNQEARIFANGILAGMKRTALSNVDKHIVKPLEKLEKAGKLSETAAKNLEKIRSGAAIAAKGAQAEADASEKYFAKKTVSRFPQKVNSQASLESVGNAMAKEFGLPSDKILWNLRDESATGVRLGTVRRTFGLDLASIDIWTRNASGKLLSQSQIKDVMVHELGHIARLAYVDKLNRRVAHHPAFKKWVEEHNRMLLETKHIPITAEQKRYTEMASEAQTMIKKISSKAHALKMSSDEMKAIIYNVTGSLDTTRLPLLSNAQLSGVYYNLQSIDSLYKIAELEAQAGLTQQQSRTLRRASGTNTNYYHLLKRYADVERPKDATLKKEEFSRMKLNARAIRRYNKPDSAWSIFRNEERLGFLNPQNWMSTRYLMDWLSRVTGKPLLERSQAVEESYRFGHHEWALFGKDLLNKIGLSDANLLAINRKSIGKINQYLYFRKALDRARLSDVELKIASALASSLDEGGQVANWIRGLRWLKLNTAYSRVEDKILLEQLKDKPNQKRINGWMRLVEKHKPPDVKKEDMLSIVEQGRVAEKNGVFDKWIASQSWGTRRIYFMSDKDWDMLAKDTLDLVGTPSLEMYEKHLKGAKIEYGPLHTRAEGARPDIVTNPYLKVKRHAYRAATLYRMYRDFEKFNNTIIAADKHLHPQDRAALEMYRNTLLGRTPEPGAAARAMIRLNTRWWEGYTAQPTRLLYFGYRNLFQNVAMLPSQVSPVEFSKAVGRLSKMAAVTHQLHPEALEDFKAYWNTSITQKRAMWETLMMTDVHARSRAPLAHRLFRFGEEVIPMSDELNRHIAWWPTHEMARHNISLLRNNKISMKTLWNRLKLRSMGVEQQEVLSRLLRDGKDREFVRRYAADKVRNSHFVYDTFGRSILEQHAANRPIIGLATWPRGAFEAYWHQCVKPIVAGVYTKNYRTSYEGIKNVTGSVVGLSAARWGMENSFGTKGFVEPYGVIGAVSYNPIAPGLGWFTESGAIATKLISMRADGKSAEEMFDYFMRGTSRQIEYFLPIVDVLKEYADKANDKEGSRMYHVLKDLLTDYDIGTDKTLKNNYQGLVDKWLTGVMGTNKLD